MAGDGWGQVSGHRRCGPLPFGAGSTRGGGRALTGDGAVGDGAPRIDPGPLDEARSYAHLAGLLPRSLQRSLEFDAAACVIRQSGGEVVVDAVSRDPLLAPYVASLREDAFTPEDERLLGELAAHTTGAFQRVDGTARALRTTARQAQVLSLIATGLSDKEIAARLGVSPRTVRTHLERFLREHRMSSRTEAATAWLRGGHGS